MEQFSFFDDEEPEQKPEKSENSSSNVSSGFSFFDDEDEPASTTSNTDTPSNTDSFSFFDVPVTTDPTANVTDKVVQDDLSGDLGSPPNAGGDLPSQSSQLDSSTEQKSFLDEYLAPTQAETPVRNTLKPYTSTFDAGVQSTTFLENELANIKQDKKQREEKARITKEANLKEENLRKDFKTILESTDPEAIAMRDKIFNIKNPNFTSVVKLNDGTWLERDVPFIGVRRVNELEAAMLIYKGNTFKASNFALNRGWGSLKNVANVVGMELGFKSPEDFFKRMAELNRVYPLAPKNIQEGLKEISEAEGWGESFKAIMRNPQAMVSVVGESLVTSAPAIGSFIAGTLVTANPITGAILATPASFATEYSLTLTGEINALGIDLDNEEEVKALMQDQEFWAKARAKGKARGIPIAVFDALSMGLAGKIVAPVLKEGWKKVTAASLAEVGVQATAGALGEAGAETGEMIIGQRPWFDYSEGEIMLEGAAEILPGGGEVAVNLNQARNAKRDAEEQKKYDLEIQSLARRLSNPQELAEVDPSKVLTAQRVEETASQEIDQKKDFEQPETLEIDSPQAVPPDKEVGFSLNTLTGSKEEEQTQTPGGEKSYGTEFVLVDIRQLKQAQGALQPRNRATKESKILAIQRANEQTFNAKRLMDSPTTGDGSPIIAKDGTIISGNGRVLTMAEVYDSQDNALTNYKNELETFLTNKIAKDLKVAPTDPKVKEDVTNLLNNYEQPILVRRLTDPNMTVENLSEMADLSNRSEQAVMSITESATRDAKAMGDDITRLFVGGELTSTENRPFVQAFVNKVVTKAEQGEFTKNGKLTNQAINRMKSAILASAFSDVDVLTTMLESPDNNIKALTNALVTVAPKFTQLKSKIDQGNIKPEFDITSDITNTAQVISDLRNKGIKPNEYFDQQDAFTDQDPMIEALIKAFYNDELTRANSQQFMETVLSYYIEETENVGQQNQLFADEVSPKSVVEGARRRTVKERKGEPEEQGKLFGEAKGNESGTKEGGKQVQTPISKRGSDDTGSVNTRDTKTKQKDLKGDFPKPNKNNIYSEEDVKPENRYYSKLPGTGNAEVEILALEVAPNQWVSSANVMLADQGGGFGLQDRDRYKTRETAIQRAIEDISYRATIRVDDKENVKKQKKALKKFFNETLESIGRGENFTESFPSNERVSEPTLTIEGEVTGLVTEQEVNNFVHSELKKILPEGFATSFFIELLEIGTRTRDFKEGYYDKLDPIGIVEKSEGSKEILDRTAFKNDGKNTVQRTRRRKAKIFIPPKEDKLFNDAEVKFDKNERKNDAIKRVQKFLDDPKTFDSKAQKDIPYEVDLRKGLHEINKKLDALGFVEAIDEAQRTKLINQENKQKGIDLDADTTSRKIGKVDTEMDQRGIESTSEPKKGKDGSTRGTKKGKITAKEMQTLRQSVFQQAFTDAGIEPKDAVNLEPKRQFKIVSDLVKEKFGFKYVAKGEISYTAVQSLLDAYRNLQFMAHVLGLPNEKMGLDGEIGLALPSKATRYNAAYISARDGVEGVKAKVQDAGIIEIPVIVMPERSNSFAHEWGHALDYHLLKRFGTEWSKGITGRIRENLEGNERPWQDSAPKSVQETMANLINAMFFDKAELAAKVMELEQKIEQTKKWEAKTGKPTKKLPALELQLKRVLEGSTRSKIGKTQYRKDAESYAVAFQSDPDYWTRPTEMFARVFEAYIASKVAGIGGTTEFITKSDSAYKLTLEEVEGADKRLALTYPNDQDRINMFLAMDRLMEAIRAEYWTGVQGANRPEDKNMVDARVDFYNELNEGASKSRLKSILPNEMQSWRINQAEKKRISERPREYNEGILTNTWHRTEDYVFKSMLYSKRGTLFAISRRNKKNPEIREIVEDIISRVATDPGGSRVTYKNGIYEEAVRIHTRRFTTRLKNIIRRNKFNALSTQQLKDLRMVLTGNAESIQNIPQNIVDGAAELRIHILNAVYDYARQNGLPLTYLEDGSYLPRVLDMALFNFKETEFKYGDGTEEKPSMTKGAYGLYHQVIYKNEVGELDIGSRKQQLEMFRLMADNTPVTIDRLKRGNQIIGRMINNAGDFAEGSVTAQDVQGDIRKFADLVPTIHSKELALKKAQENPKDNAKQIEKLEKQIAKLDEQLEEIHEGIYKMLQPAFADVATIDWVSRITEQQGNDVEAHSSINKFMKQRKLPKEADTFMIDFYTDPIEALTTYIPSVVRKVEYENRFGSKNIPEGKPKKDQAGNNIDYLQYQLNRLKNLKLNSDDVAMIKDNVDIIVGRTNPFTDRKFKKTGDFFYTMGTMAILGRAVLSSIAEPITIAIQTGSSKSALKNMAYLFDEGLNGLTSRERTVYFRQMASILGVVDDPEVGEMVANRLGGTLQDSPTMTRWLSRYFVNTKLQGLTNAQRRSSMRVFLQFFHEISKEYKDPNTSDKRKKQIKNTFLDLGIVGQDLDQFIDFMIDSREQRAGFKAPALEDIMGKTGELSDMGQLLSVAITRAVDTTIQDPKVVDRPKYAEMPIGRMVYGITSFSRAYTRNVLLASVNRVKREYRTNGAVSATTMASLHILPQFALLYAGHFAVSTAREALFNADEWERRSEEGELFEWLWKVAWSRAGFFGALDPIAQAYASLRYESDIKNLLNGAQVGFYATAVDRILTFFGQKNSPNTLTAEYNATRGFFDIVGAGLLSLGAAVTPGVISGTVAGAGAILGTSADFKKWVSRKFVELVYGDDLPIGKQSGSSKSKSRFGGKSSSSSGSRFGSGNSSGSSSRFGN